MHSVTSSPSTGSTSRWCTLADDSAEVAWVTSSELADPTPYLEGGELLLTTGLSTAGWHDEWDGYVARLLAAGVAALGLGTGLTHGASPSDLVSACVRQGMNLLEIPRTVTFVAVSREAARLVEDAERHAAQATLARQRVLIAAAASLPGTRSLVRALAQTVGGAAAVLDWRGRPVVGPVGEPAEALDLARAAEEVARLRQQRGRSTSRVVDGTNSLEVQPLGAGERADLYLAIGAPGRSEGPCRITIATAVALLGYAVEGERQGQATERSVRSRAVELVLSGDPLSGRTLLGSLEGQPVVPGRCRVVRALGGHKQLSEGLLLAEASDLLARLDDDELTIVIPAGLPREHEILGEFEAAGLRLGVGPEVSVARAGTSHKNAGLALAETLATSRVVHWDGLVSLGAAAMLDRGRAPDIARSYLRPLSPMLILTLRAFIHHHGSHVKVAQELGVHRNTVRARVARIEALLGDSLDDPHTRATAWIALHLVER